MIKYIIGLLTVITISFQAISQVKDYDETALIFSQEKLNGTARYLAMSGAFGALGGDLSAVEINPAGLAIFNSNTASITLDVNSIDGKSNLYNLSSTYQSSKLGFAQAGGLLEFENSNDKWRKFTISINTSISNNFDNEIRLNGNTHFSNESFFLNPEDGANLYNNVEEQKISDFSYGYNSKTTFNFATQFDKNTYFGFSVISNSIDYNNDIIIHEFSKDTDDNTFNARLNQSQKVFGDGISFNFGVLSKPIENFRIGLAYQTPTWYSLTEEFSENITVDLSNAEVTQPDNVNNIYDYQLRTPGKITGSLAYVFGKDGLLSLDYQYKDYSKAQLSPTTDFEGNYHNNARIKENYTAVSTVNIGGEYRFKYISLRAGYHYETNPIKELSSDYTTSYSTGFGFKTSDYSKLDFAFNKTSYSKNSYFLSAPKSIISKNDIAKFTVTYSVNF